MQDIRFFGLKQEFINKKKSWIADKQNKVSVFGEKHPPVSVRTGESLMYLGNSYAIIKDAINGVKVTAIDGDTCPGELINR